MYLCYVDETGTRDPRLSVPQKDGTSRPGDWLYVLTALCIFEQRWHTMEKPINRYKAGLMNHISIDAGASLSLPIARSSQTGCGSLTNEPNTPF